MVHRLHPDVDLRQHPRPLPRLPHRQPLQERPREAAPEHEEKNLVTSLKFDFLLDAKSTKFPCWHIG